MGGTDVSGGADVFVGGGTSVSGGTRVFVGGIGVDDGIGVAVEGMRVAVDVATGWRPGPRVLVGGMRVRVGETTTVDVLELLGAGENDGVSDMVGVNTY